MTDKLFDRLMTVMAIDELFDAQVDVMCDNMTNTMGMPAAVSKTWKAAFTEAFTAETFSDVFKKDLAKRFSDKELETVIDFFESGVGRRWVTEQGDMMRNINGQIESIVKKRLPLVQEIFARQLAALPYDEQME